LSQADILLDKDYPAPIVEHDAARKLTLAGYDVVRALKNDVPPID
jgi:deoxyribodipyrimidine photo-lyase